MAFLVGVAGGSASGKTTLAKALANRLGDRACCLEQDAYYRDQAHIPPDRRAGVNYDHPDALENALLVEHLRALREGRAVDVPVYDYARHTRTAMTHRVTPSDITVVAGLHLLSVPELRGCFDLAVYVEADPDVRLARRIERDVTERGRDLAGVLAQWFATVRPMHDCFVAPSREHADVTVGGEGGTDAAVDRIVSRLPR